MSGSDIRTIIWLQSLLLLPSNGWFSIFVRMQPPSCGSNFQTDGPISMKLRRIVTHRTHTTSTKIQLDCYSCCLATTGNTISQKNLRLFCPHVYSSESTARIHIRTLFRRWSFSIFELGHCFLFFPSWFFSTKNPKAFLPARVQFWKYRQNTHENIVQKMIFFDFWIRPLFSFFSLLNFFRNRSLWRELTEL